MKSNHILTVLGIAGLLTMSSQASLDCTFLTPGYADGSRQITVTYPTNYSGGENSRGGIWVGQLIMENATTHQPFTTFCLSPAGMMHSGPTAYNPLSPEDARYGINPSAWSPTGGIENAVCIWSLHNSTLSNNTEGVALNLAMWAALYNSTAVGSMTSSGRFSVSGAGFTPDMQTAYAADIAELNAIGSNAVEAVFRQSHVQILRPVDASMQDLIIATPEPSTLLGTALLALLMLGEIFSAWLKRLQSGLSAHE